MLGIRGDGVGARRAALGLAAFAAAGLAGQRALAQAQIAPGYSGSSSANGFVAGNEETWQTLRVFGACFARNNRPQAFTLLATEPGSAAEAQASRQMFRDGPQDCMGYTRRMRAPISLLRGAIAEGLMKRHIPIPADLVAPAPAPGAQLRSAGDAARCYAAAHPDRVRGLLATPLGSRREAETIAAIVNGGLSRCLPEGAGPQTPHPTRLRYALVEALLRLPASPPASAGQR